MEQIDKQNIAAEVARLAAQSSGNAIAVKAGVSSATISNINSGKWERISDDMWLKVAAYIRSASATTSLKAWNVVTDTRAYQQLQAIFSDAQEGSLVMAVCGDAGCGKSVAARCYAEEHANAIVISCDDYWNRKMFLAELLRAMGRNASGYSVGEMMHEVVNAFKRMQQPLIVLDEADKLSDHVLYFFITLYNNLEDQCGIVLMATDYLEKKMKRGLRLNKKGYKEINSRIGRRCIGISSPDANDVAAICVANGIDERRMLKAIYDDCDSDIRRVRRKVFAAKSKQRKAEA